MWLFSLDLPYTQLGWTNKSVLLKDTLEGGIVETNICLEWDF